MPDDQTHLSVNYFHVIGSLFLQLVTDDYTKVGVLDYFAMHGMMILLGSTCADPRRKMTVHSLVVYAK